ncbi:MAG: nitrilase-related carbon-nitrogen hydrolase, partial [Prevotellamassilia sp.]|nr:nitrilase-related carbon-nitrogen hydrolase [Prevotellamassilia sp.]
MQYGYIKVAAGVPAVHLADPAANTEAIQNMMVRAEGQGVEVLCLPELCLTGYTCQDLFAQQLLLEEAESALLRLIEFSRNLSLVTLVGVPVACDGMLFNCAAVIQRGKLFGFVPKTYLPNYKEFYEGRW